MKTGKSEGFQKISDIDEKDLELQTLHQEDDTSLQKFEDSDFIDRSQIKRNYGNYWVFRLDQNGDPKIAFGPQCNLNKNQGHCLSAAGPASAF